MNIGVEISLYPLRNDFIPPIRGFIDRLNADGRFKVVTNDMSTQVFGRYDEVMEALTRELRPTFEHDGKSIFVMKVLGPLLVARHRELPRRSTRGGQCPGAGHGRGLCRAGRAPQSPVLDRGRRELRLRRHPVRAQQTTHAGGLQIFYVGMSVYGWWSWKRHSSEGQLMIGVWPLGRHLGAALVLTFLSLVSAYWLRPADVAAWPLLDSVTTWFSLLATWLAARAKLENWLYWIVINALMVFLFYAQKVWGMALLSRVPDR